ncbi:MAG: hypothetical protein R3C59_19165 [Planctomycetaceae bacterium]
MSHRIRLAGPWDISRDGHVWDRAALPLPETVADQAIQLRRRFHRPTGLTAASVVTLVVIASGPAATLLLNDEPIGSLHCEEQNGTVSTAFDVTERLQEFNTALLRTDPASESGPQQIVAVHLMIED